VIHVIGIGNLLRGDDAAGIEVARRVRARVARGDVTVTELAGDQLALLDTWTGAKAVYIVDAVRSGSRPGSVYRFDAAGPLDPPFRGRGTHTFSLADVIELARVLGRLPSRLLGYGIEGQAFELGEPLSPAAAAAVDAVAEELLRMLEEGE
jgi:hydrogenase maturation protease